MDSDSSEATGTKRDAGLAPSLLLPTRSNLSREYGWLFRWAPLLYTAFWFITPWYRHSARGWAVFALFYAAFLACYFLIFRTRGRAQWICLGVLFALGYIYSPFCPSASGEFVYPVVLSVYFLRHAKASSAFLRFAAILLAQAAGVLLETWLLHLNLVYAENVIFYSVAIGLSNFAFSRTVLATERLEQANQEIEHLTQVAERERIARDLHDLLGHTLTLIVLKSDIANRLFTAQPEVAHREIAEVEATARKALSEVREAVAGYRAEGLPAEVSRARRALTSAGVQLTTEIEYLPLPAGATNTLCLVLREAITNVIRHADATACHLELRSDGDRLTMRIEDNGQGDLEGKLEPEGNGLRGMRERLIQAGGTLHRQRTESGGTRLTAEITLPSAAIASAAPRIAIPAKPIGAADEAAVRA